MTADQNNVYPAEEEQAEPAEVLATRQKLGGQGHQPLPLYSLYRAETADGKPPNTMWHAISRGGALHQLQRFVDPWLQDYLSVREAANWGAFGEISDCDLASTTQLLWRQQELDYLYELAAGNPPAPPLLHGKRATEGDPVPIELSDGTTYMGSTFEFDELSKEFEATSDRIAGLLADTNKTPSALLFETQASIKELQQRIKKFEAALFLICEAFASGTLKTCQLPDVGVFRNRESPDWRLARALPNAISGWFATSQVLALFPGRSVVEDSAKPPLTRPRAPSIRSV